MVQISKAEKKTVYRYLLQEGVIVLHKDYSAQPHKGTNVPNIHVRTLLRSLKDRGLVDLVFNWQHFYYFINQEGKKFLTEFLGLTEEVVPLTWKKDEKRQYEHMIEDRGRKVRRDREERPQGERRGGRGGPRAERGERKERREEPVQADKPTEATATA
jgi:small subunit ribosomal protein S10e